MSKSLLLFAALSASLLLGSGCVTCDDVAEAANACYAEAGIDGEFSCSGTPPNDVGTCQIEAYETGDCSTPEGVLDADAAANACALQIFF